MCYVCGIPIYTCMFVYWFCLSAMLPSINKTLDREIKVWEKWQLNVKEKETVCVCVCASCMCVSVVTKRVCGLGLYSGKKTCTLNTHSTQPVAACNEAKIESKKWRNDSHYKMQHSAMAFGWWCCCHWAHFVEIDECVLQGTFNPTKAFF